MRDSHFLHLCLENNSLILVDAWNKQSCKGMTHVTREFMARWIAAEK